MNGFIKFFRALLSLECMHDNSFLSATVRLMANARYMPTIINGYPVEAGQLIVNVNDLAEECLLTRKNIMYILHELSRIRGIKTEKIGKDRYIITLLPLLLTGAGITPDLLYVQGRSRIDYNISPLYQAYIKKQAISAEEKKEEGLSHGNEGVADSYEKCEPFSVAENFDFCEAEDLSAKIETESETKAENAKKVNEEEREESGCYGKFGNVRLSKEEYEEIKKQIPSYKNYIELFSAYLAANSKDYDNHYAAIYSWYLRDNERGRVKPAVTVNMPVNPLYPNGTSYDLERAEKRALESVPKLKKREKR